VTGCVFFVFSFGVSCVFLKRSVFKKRHFSVEPNVSLNYLLSCVNMNDVWELDSALETNMFEIEMLNAE